MYNYEIDTYLQEKNFTLTSDELNYIKYNSSQVITRLLKFGDVYSRYVIRTNDNVNWEVMVKNKLQV